MSGLGADFISLLVARWPHQLLELNNGKDGLLFEAKSFLPATSQQAPSCSLAPAGLPALK